MPLKKKKKERSQVGIESQQKLHGKRRKWRVDQQDCTGQNSVAVCIWLDIELMLDLKGGNFAPGGMRWSLQR